VSDPLAQLQEWFAQARAAGLQEPEAAALATATPDGRPSVRMVLLRGIDARGVAFYTNRESRKGRELAANPRAALAVLWKPLHRQVRLEGDVERLSATESDAYFATRGRGSRLGAWASAQSTEIPGREVLDARLAEASERFPGDVPRPEYWGGYLLRPHAIEFWSGRPDRLHDREEFRREEGAWRSRRLSP
jgi:pyridoxamine 5'-phosphate oxidase